MRRLAAVAALLLAPALAPAQYLHPPIVTRYAGCWHGVACFTFALYQGNTDFGPGSTDDNGEFGYVLGGVYQPGAASFWASEPDPLPGTARIGIPGAEYNSGWDMDAALVPAPCQSMDFDARYAASVFTCDVDFGTAAPQFRADPFLAPSAVFIDVSRGTPGTLAEDGDPIDTQAVQLDRMAAVVTPEPATVALAGAGMLLLGVWARRREV